MTQAIVVDQFRKTYPRTWKNAPFEAVRGISFKVNEGEVFGFIGPNGAGKSTTIKVLTGATPPTSGEVSLFGVNCSFPAARKGMGYVPENPSLPDYLTPMEMLLMGIKLHKLATSDPYRHCMECLEKLGLALVANKIMRGFSKGMIQRAALANGLCTNPRLLILDEPLSGLDPIGRRDVVNILAEFKKSGGSIFLTSHVLHDIERLADRFGLIHRGELKTIASPKELMGKDEVLLIRSQGHKEIPGMSRDSDDRWQGECKREDLWSNLHQLELSGHEILEVKPLLNLEGLFMKYVKGE